MTQRGSPARLDSGAPFYGIAELAGALGVSRQAIQARVRRGSIRAVKEGGVWRIPAGVAVAMVNGEHAKAIVSGEVTALPRAANADATAADSKLVSQFAERLQALEAIVEAAAERLDAALVDQQRRDHARDRELEEIRRDRAKLRRALAALVVDGAE